MEGEILGGWIGWEGKGEGRSGEGSRAGPRACSGVGERWPGVAVIKARANEGVYICAVMSA